MNVISAYMLISSGDATTGGPYTVRFYDDEGNLIQTDANVPQYGTAHCTILDGTIRNGLYFKGWNPSPSVVTHNLDCYPVRGDYVIRHEETRDSWDTICADCGAHYPLGTYKSLVLNIPAYVGAMRTRRVCYSGNWIEGDFYTTPPASSQDLNVSAVNLSLDMVKVAEGEDGSTSTWLSTGVIGLRAIGVTPGSSQNVHTFEYGYFRSDDDENPFRGEKLQFDWGTCGVYQWMNDHMIHSFPEILQATIKDVTKAYASHSLIPVNNNYRGGGLSLMVEKNNLSKIWVPSMKEMHTMFASASNWSDYTGFEESTGIDYTAIYMPTYGKFMVRSLITGENFINPLFWQGNNSIGPIDASSGDAPFGFCL